MQYQLNNPAPLQLNLVGQHDQLSVFQASILHVQSRQRPVLEQFIRNTFSRYYQATILHFYPFLLGAFEQGQPFAAIGYRNGQDHLFLEQYLPEPIETILSSISGQPVQRTQITEIGNLAAIKPGACLHIFQLLSLYFHSSQIQWIVFTGTRTVRIILKRLGIKAYRISPASAGQLTPNQDWGSYYRHTPMVMAAPVGQAITAIQDRYRLVID